MIDPMTNNTSAVGMIIDELKDRDLPSKITDMTGKGLIAVSVSFRQENVKSFMTKNQPPSG